LVSYNTLLQTFKAELSETEKYKKDTILKLAKKLEEEKKVPVNEINDKISNDLEGYVSRQYVGQCLDKKYKQSEKITSPKKKSKEKEIEIATNGSVITEEEKDKAEFYSAMDKALDRSDQELKSLNSTVVNELDKANNKVKELEAKLANTVTEEEYRAMEKRVNEYEESLEDFKNHIGEYVRYDKDLQITNVMPAKGKEKDRVKISLRKFENQIKDSFKRMQPFAFIEHDGQHATNWT
jgi:hypothetical protein